MASPIPTSAAATVITNSAKICPVSRWSCRYWLKAASEHAVDAGREQHGRIEEQQRQADHSVSSFRAITTAPISAASSRTETTSNGSTNPWNRDFPT